MRLKPLLTLGATALLVTACGSAGTETAENTEPQTIVAATTIDGQASEKVNTLFSISATAHQAQQVAVANCISEKGGTWQRATTTQEQYDIRQQFPLQSLTVEQARQHGYQAPSPVDEAQPGGGDDATMALYSGDPANGSVTVDGIPGAIAADGCLAQSYEEVFGSAEAGVLFEGGIGNLPLPYLNAALEDKQYDALLEEWHTCMKDTYDIDIATPDLASVDTSMDSTTLAVYDATCRENIGFENTVENLLDAYLTTFLSEQDAVIDQLTSAKETAEQNAPAILGG